ncbi:MAG TPA: hypothetical protein PKK79_07690 [Syntrophorhabdaceae bacterium]|nr:hypothetical protein [Syntrophorhabdaceae bacterium]
MVTEGVHMKRGREDILHTANLRHVLILVTAIMLVSLSFPSFTFSSEGAQTISGRVDYINESSLFINGIEYPLARYVRVTVSGERNFDITLATIIPVSFINRARVYIEQGYVTWIVILEVQQ